MTEGPPFFGVKMLRVRGLKASGLEARAVKPSPLELSRSPSFFLVRVLTCRFRRSDKHNFLSVAHSRARHDAVTGEISAWVALYQEGVNIPCILRCRGFMFMGRNFVL